MRTEKKIQLVHTEFFFQYVLEKDFSRDGIFDVYVCQALIHFLCLVKEDAGDLPGGVDRHGLRGHDCRNTEVIEDIPLTDLFGKKMNKKY